MAMCRSSQACALESCVHRPMQFSSLLASVGTTGAVSQSNVDPELVWRVSACSLLNVGTLKANPLLGHASMSHRVMTFLHPCTRSDLRCISLGLGPRLTFRRAFRFAGLRLTGLFQVSPLWLGLHLFALGFGTEHGLEIKSLCGLSRTGTLIEIGLRLRKEIRIGLKHILRSRRDFRSLVRSDLLIAVSDKILDHFLGQSHCLDLHRTLHFDRTAGAFKLDCANLEDIKKGTIKLKGARSASLAFS